MSDSIRDAMFFFETELSLRSATTLLHFLWQGCVIGVVAVVAARAFKEHAAVLRYWLYSLTLLACPVCVAVTFSVVKVPERFLPYRTAADVAAMATDPLSPGNASPAADMPYPVMLPPSTNIPAALPDSGGNSAPTGSVPASAAVADTNADQVDLKRSEAAATLYRSIATWLMVAYLIGVVGFLLRLSVALWGGHRLRTNSVPLADSAMLALVRNQAQRIGLRLVPVVAYCERVAVPTVIGVLRPIVLLPATVMTGLTADEFSAIISHEFAHIRRYDLWMNLLQRLIESLLFFHPVVWFLSRHLSTEREICCDDLVVRSGHEPMNYAGALLRMAELCAGVSPQNSLALAATSGGASLLEHRVLRLMQASPSTRLHLNRKGLFALASAMLLALAIFVPLSRPLLVNPVNDPLIANAATIIGEKVEPSDPTRKSDNAPSEKASVEEPASTTVAIAGRLALADGTLVENPGTVYIVCRSGKSTSYLGAGNLEAGLFSKRVPAGKIFVAAIVDGYAPAWTDEFELTEGTKDNLVLVLSSGATKAVRVVDEGNKPVVSATVCKHPQIYGQVLGANLDLNTNERGLIVMEHLADTRYQFRISAPGFQTLRTDAISVSGNDELTHMLKQCRPATGTIFNSDGTPAAGAELFKSCEAVSSGPNSNTSYYSTGSGGHEWLGQKIATTNAEGRYEIDQLNDDSQYMIAIQGPDGSRMFLSDLTAGQSDRRIGLPERRDLVIKVTGDTSALPLRDGMPFVVIRQSFMMRMPASGHGSSNSLGADIPLELNDDGGSAVFPGLIIDPASEAKSAHAEVGLGYGEEWKKIVPINPAGITEVVFNLPAKVGAGSPAAANDAQLPASSEVQIRYPYCVVETENLLTRPLTDSIAAFNLTSQESPTGLLEQPVTEQETRDAIAKFAAEDHVPQNVRTQLIEILKSGMLPSNFYFRRFTRFDDGERMNDVWWVRLVVETKGEPVYSVPVRMTSIDSRPYTQMERQQNAADGMTLLNRVSSYRRRTEDWPPRIPTMREAAIDRLIDEVKQALKSKDIEALKLFSEWTNTSDSIRRFAESELQTLVDSSDHSVWVTPPESDRSLLLTWSAWQQYKPNLPVVGYLKISYTPAGEKPDVRKRLTFELGQVGDELRIVNYVTDGEPDPPKSLDPGPSITGHIEPLADETFLVTETITNPGTLLSAHLANEEIRQRDLNGKEVAAEAEAEPDVPDDNAGEKADPKVKAQQSETEVSPPIDDTQQRELLLKAVAEADQISGDQARQKAQWELVGMLVKTGLTDEAFQQALKLKLVNPQTCIYSLTTIAQDAMAKGKEVDVQRAWELAKATNKDAIQAFGFEHYVIEMGFKFNRPIDDLIAVASAAKPNGRQNAYRDIRNELAWRGRLDEAYSISAKYLPTFSKEFNDREIAYYCSNAKHYDYNVKHDHFGQAIRIIEQMSRGTNRNAAIDQLIQGLLYVADNDTVSEERFALAEKWVEQIDDHLMQAAARARIMKTRRPVESLEELELAFSETTSREEKEVLLQRIFWKQMESGDFEAADGILARQIQSIKEQPRAEQKSKFGNFDDDDAVRVATWSHHRNIIQALMKADRKDEARAWLDKLSDVPDSEPLFLVGNWEGIRLMLYRELKDFDAVEKISSKENNPLATIEMAAWMMQNGQFDRGWKHVAPLMELTSDALFPPEVRTKSLYFAAQPIESLAKELFKANRPDDALVFVNKLPESSDTAYVFETFGELLVTSGRTAELEQWIAKLPHETARTHARLGALRAMTPKESASLDR